jgi:hypothetical protein
MAATVNAAVRSPPNLFTIHKTMMIRQRDEGDWGSVQRKGVIGDPMQGGYVVTRFRPGCGRLSWGLCIVEVVWRDRRYETAYNLIGDRTYVHDGVQHAQYPGYAAAVHFHLPHAKACLAGNYGEMSLQTSYGLGGVGGEGSVPPCREDEW